MDVPIVALLQSARIDWDSSVKDPYLFVATFQGKQVYLRLNEFPAEPLCTVLVDGIGSDLHEFPKSWTLPRHRENGR